MPRAGVIIEAIVPDRGWEKDRLPDTLRHLEIYMRGSGGSKIQGEMRKTTKGWGGKPSFTKKFRRNSFEMVVNVYPTGKHAQKWVWVSGGTGPRRIVSGRNLMSFPADYTPRTRPGGRYGGSGQKHGPMVWRRRVVGTVKPHRIEPREFSKEVAKEVGNDLLRDVRRIIVRGLR